ncbi:hypothetical protein C9J12_22645 [Photobacterium frigidiphilum]|uniref:Uncharacterized protein n=1 Tax=Photobacterium frigidiphilum TaxID=264736 RepID=A0A2T3J9J3_9GAMM|nr:hypothetical protein C9J12_22645 [Photobacterium frigidiphilum]
MVDDFYVRVIRLNSATKSTDESPLIFQSTRPTDVSRQFNKADAGEGDCMNSWTKDQRIELKIKNLFG